MTASLCFAQPVDTVGRITAFRNARVSSRPTSGGSFAAAVLNQHVRNGDGIRTERRGFAQINFTDRSALRLSELTELIVQDALTLRRLQLARGALWLRVTKGANTSVQTPVATATVRGTEFLINSMGNVAVREGMVELEAGGLMIEIRPGEVGGINGDGRPFKKSVAIPVEPQVDVELLGVPEDWWKILRSGEPKHAREEYLAILFLPFFIPGGGSGGRSAVPEPGTALVLAAGAAYLYAARKRRSNR